MNDDDEEPKWKRWGQYARQYARDEWRLAMNDPVASWLFNPLGSLLSRTRWGRGLLWLMPIVLTRLLVLLVPWAPNMYAASQGAPVWVLIVTEVGGGVATIALMVLWWRQARAWWRSRGKWQA